MRDDLAAGPVLLRRSERSARPRRQSSFRLVAVAPTRLPGPLLVPRCDSQRAVPLSAALELFLEVAQVPWHFLARLRADEERNEQLADPVPHEVELDRHARPRIFIERRDRSFDVAPDRSIDAANGPARRGTQFSKFRRHRPLDATDPTSDAGPRAHAGRTGSLHATANNALLPLGETCGVGDVREDFFGRAGDLDARSDWCHSPSSSRATPQSSRTSRSRGDPSLTSPLRRASVFRLGAQDARSGRQASVNRHGALATHRSTSSSTTTLTPTPDGAWLRA